MHRGQLWDVLHQRIVQRKQAAVAQLQDRYAGEGLGAGGPMIRRIVIHRHIGSPALQAIILPQNHAPIAHQRQTAAHDAIAA